MQHLSRVLELVSSSASHDCLHIVSPYITVNPIRAILKRLTPNEEIEVTTTFDQELFLDGASSLGAIRLINSRENSRIYIVDSLHAKLYIRGQKALIGSANCTDRGLGCSSKSNIEILCDVESNRPEIRTLAEVLKTRRRRLQGEDIARMIQLIAESNSLIRSVFRTRLEAILGEDPWVPSCSLSYLLRYLSDGSFYRIPAENKVAILRDAQYLATKLGEEALAYKNELIESISLLPVVQLAIDSILSKNKSLEKCLAARGVSIGRIEALYNWGKTCLVADRSMFWQI